jgi:hypothetical protein
MLRRIIKYLLRVSSVAEIIIEQIALEKSNQKIHNLEMKGGVMYPEARIVNSQNDKKAITISENKHFYKESQRYSDKKYLSMYDTDSIFYSYYLLWKDYRLVKEYLSFKNTIIYNSTNGGFLDVFPRIPLENSVKNIVSP